MRILAIDPGTTESAYMVLQQHAKERLDPYSWGKIPNWELRQMLRANDIQADFFAIEMIAGSYGKTVGQEVFETAAWIGTFEECWYSAVPNRNPPIRVFRKTAVTYITDNPKANDAAVRQALIDRYGGNSVALAKQAKCEDCRGKREVAHSVHREEACLVCFGTGKVTGARGFKRCSKCKGVGQFDVKSVVSESCLGCRGTGKTGCDGPLVGVTKDCWAALAVGLTAWETDRCRDSLHAPDAGGT